jgi:hypothetical protein
VTVNDEPLQHLPYHSPDGFEWGDSGRGSADLALAILADYLNEVDDVLRYLGRPWGRPPPASLHYHQAFKKYVVSAWPKEGWELDPLVLTFFLIAIWSNATNNGA